MHCARVIQLKTQQSPIIVAFCSRKTGLGKSRDYRFSVHPKTQRRRFQNPPFEERFRRDPVSWRISVNGRPNCRNRAAFLKFLWLVERFWRASFSWWISVDGLVWPVDLYSAANDPQPQMFPRPEMILRLDSKWSRTTNEPRCGPQMIPMLTANDPDVDRKWSRCGPQMIPPENVNALSLVSRIFCFWILNF